MAGTASSQLEDLRFGLRTIDNTLGQQRASKKSYEISLASAKKSGNVTAVIRLTDTISDLNKKITANTKIRANLVSQINKLTKQVVVSQGPGSKVTTPKPKNTKPGSSSSTASGNTSVTDPDKTQKPAPDAATPTDTTPIEYNLPAAKDAYFKNMKLMYDGRVGLINPGNTKVDDAGIYVSNSPTRIQNASELWTSAIGSKGMIQTYIPRADAYNDIFAGVDAKTLSDLNAGVANRKKYAFQFQYNPSTISMAISGAAAVDYMKYVNDTPQVVPDFGTTSNISFSIIVNRMFDMSYINSSGALKNNLSTQDVYGVTTADAAAHVKEIHDKGTMYDVEYLLKTIVGFDMKTLLRGQTADVGFLMGRLIELHLGKSLRYLVTITGISISHVIFDNRMVPLYSTINITANRVPDFAPKVKQG